MNAHTYTHTYTHTRAPHMHTHKHTHMRTHICQVSKRCFIDKLETIYRCTAVLTKVHGNAIQAPGTILYGLTSLHSLKLSVLLVQLDWDEMVLAGLEGGPGGISTTTEAGLSCCNGSDCCSSCTSATAKLKWINPTIIRIENANLNRV